MYNTYEILIRTNSGAKHIEVCAISIDAALADLNEAFSGVEVITWSTRWNGK